jgi:hypothetical protein
MNTKIQINDNCISTFDMCLIGGIIHYVVSIYESDNNQYVKTRYGISTPILRHALVKMLDAEFY